MVIVDRSAGRLAGGVNPLGETLASRGREPPGVWIAVWSTVSYGVGGADAFFHSAGLGLPETREEAIAGRSTGTGDLNTGTNSHKVVSQLRNPGKEIKAPLPCNNGTDTTGVF